MESSFLDTLGAWLGNYLIHSTVLISVIWILSGRIRSLVLRDRLWKFALVGAIYTASLQGLLGSPSFSWSLHPAPEPTSARATTESASETPRISVPALPTISVSSPPAESESAAPYVPPPAPRSLPWKTLIPALWLVGALFGLSGFTLIRLRFFHSIRDRILIQGGILRQILNRLCWRSGVEKSVALSSTEVLATPVALGTSEISIPHRSATDLSPQQQECMLAHELAHIQRRDPFWIWFAGFLTSLFFFQPLNRLARNRYQANAELLCDDWVVERTGNGKEMAHCLAEVAGWMQGGREPVACMAGTGSPLVQRIKRLLERKDVTKMKKSSKWMLIGGLGMISVLALVAPGFSVPAQDGKKGETRDSLEQWKERQLQEYAEYLKTQRAQNESLAIAKAIAEFYKQQGLDLSAGSKDSTEAYCRAFEAVYGLSLGHPNESLAHFLGKNPEEILAISAVKRNDWAWNLGFRPFDLITELGGDEATRDRLGSYLHEAVPPSSLVFTVNRKGEIHLIEISLDKETMEYLRGEVAKIYTERENRQREVLTLIEDLVKKLQVIQNTDPRKEMDAAVMHTLREALGQLGYEELPTTITLPRTTFIVEEPAEIVEPPDEPEPARVHFAFENADIRQVINSIARVSGTQIIYGPRVKGNITLRLDEMPYRVALDKVAEHMGYTVEEWKPGVLQIRTPESLPIDNQYSINLEKLEEEKKFLEKERQELEARWMEVHDIMEKAARIPQEAEKANFRTIVEILSKINQVENVATIIQEYDVVDATEILAGMVNSGRPEKASSVLTILKKRNLEFGTSVESRLARVLAKDPKKK